MDFMLTCAIPMTRNITEGQSAARTEDERPLFWDTLCDESAEKGTD